MLNGMVQLECRNGADYWSQIGGRDTFELIPGRGNQLTDPYLDKQEISGVDYIMVMRELKSEHSPTVYQSRTPVTKNEEERLLWYLKISQK